MIKPPTQAQISTFVHWESMRKDMIYVKCKECPFEELCLLPEESLCQHLSRYIQIIRKLWGLPKEDGKEGEPI